MNQVSVLEVNVAPTSTSGHFVKGANQVINLDEVTETFDVIGKSTLETANHQTVVQNEDCTILTQQVFNPFAKMYEKSVD